jgi:hypothetical protein
VGPTAVEGAMERSISPTGGDRMSIFLCQGSVLVCVLTLLYILYV